VEGHKAYVDTGNKLLEGTDLAGKSVEEIVKASYNTKPGADRHRWASSSSRSGGGCSAGRRC
jgi:superoxide dismutase